jgi:hypothetical protein
LIFKENLLVAVTLTEQDVLTFIGSLDDPGIDIVLRALQERHDTLHGQRRQADTARLRVGTLIEIAEVHQEYLKGLIGDIVHIGTDDDEGYVDVLLSQVSTGRLRFCHESEYEVGGEPRYLLQGVPVSCCFEQDAVAQAV